jgi:hypothetical protein
MTTVPSDYTADPSYRLGVAKELLRNVLDPNHPGTRVHGPGYLPGRIREFLAGEGEQGMGHAETAAQTAIAALRTPWPQHAANGLYPGDMVTHPDFGAGRLCGFNDAEWPSAFKLVTAGQVLVDFDDPADARWVPAVHLEAVPGERDADWQAASEEAEQRYLNEGERYQYEGT